MKKISFLLLLFSFFAFSQNNRFIYEYRYVPNLNEKDNVRKEMMLLDVDSKGSQYYSHEKFAQDSLLKENLKNQIAMGGNSFNLGKKEKSGGITYKVIKTYPDFKVFLIDRVGQDSYKIAEDGVLKWQILPEIQKIGEYSAQKAKTTFGGREWTAWFCKDIPIADGPYKLYGLPGLIVKAEDATGTHIMTLVANRKISRENQNSDMDIPGLKVTIFGMGGKEIEVSKKQFRKVWQDYLNDPAKNLREMITTNSSGATNLSMKVKTSDGSEISDMNEMYKMIEKRVKEEELKNNNKIEPSLYDK